MRRFFVLLLACGLLPLAGLGLVAADHAPATGCAAHVYLDGHDTGRRVPIAPDRPEYAQLCAPVASPSAVPSPSPSHSAHPSPSPVAAGWHAPGSHDGLNVHEHGAGPPQWVLDSGHAPFSQDRESHTGYKGVYARDNGGKGVESYLITHVLSTVGARSHGDHDYELYVRLPTGGVFYSAGLLDFGNPPPLRTRDTGERPIILSVNDGACETWYGRILGGGMDLGWTICGRYQRFDGTILGGRGAFRTVDWLIVTPVGHPLRPYCTVEFGVCRVSWIVNSVDYDPQGVVTPIN